MLRLTLEIVPFGMESCARSIGTMEIANVTPRRRLNREIADYDVTLELEDGEVLTTKVTRFDRERGAWVLIHSALGKLKKQMGRVDESPSTGCEATGSRRGERQRDR